MSLPQGEQDQRTAIQGWCAEMGVSPSGEIREDLSDYKASRQSQISRLLSPLGAGDVLVATEIAALGRSLVMIWDVVRTVLERGATLYAIKESLLIDNPDSPICQTLQSAAAIQRRITEIRTRDALQAAASRGRKGGRPHRLMKTGDLKLSAHKSTIRRMLEQGASVSEIARTLHCDRQTVTTFIKRSGLEKLR